MLYRIHPNDLHKKHEKDPINFFLEVLSPAIDLPDLLLQLCIQLHTSCYMYQLASVTRSLAIHTCEENREGYIGAVMDIASVGLLRLALVIGKHLFLHAYLDRELTVQSLYPFPTQIGAHTYHQEFFQ